MAKHSIKPYKHDCEACIWVSWIHLPGHGKWGSDWGNMYFCPARQGKSPLAIGSVVIRFSDEPSDYWSCGVGETIKGSIDISSVVNSNTGD